MQKGLADGSYHPAAGQARPRGAHRPASITGPMPLRAPGPGSTGSSKRKTVPRTSRSSELPAGAVRDGKVWLPRLLTETGLVASNGEARRAHRAGRGAHRRPGGAATPTPSSIPRRWRRGRAGGQAQVPARRVAARPFESRGEASGALRAARREGQLPPRSGLKAVARSFRGGIPVSWNNRRP